MLRVVALIVCPTLAIAALLAAGFLLCRVAHAPALPPWPWTAAVGALAGAAAAFAVVVLSLIVTREGRPPRPPAPPMHPQ